MYRFLRFEMFSSKTLLSEFAKLYLATISLREKRQLHLLYITFNVGGFHASRARTSHYRSNKTHFTVILPVQCS